MEIVESSRFLELKFGDARVQLPNRKKLFVDHASTANGFETHCLIDTVYPKSTPNNIEIIIKENELSQINFVGHNGFSVVGFKISSLQARMFLAKLIELEIVK